MSNGDLERDAAEEEVEFLPRTKPNADDNTCNSFGGLLSREDLLNLDKKEPKWRRMRLILLILFWFIWIGLLVASIVIIVLSPRCPAVPTLSFWQSKVGYWVDPFAFRDSDGDLVGDFKGLITAAQYVKSTIGAGFIVLDSFLHGQFTNEQKKLGLTSDFKRPDEALGTMDDFRTMVKAYHRIGVEVVVSFDFNSVSEANTFVRDFGKPSFDDKLYARNGDLSTVTVGGKQYYSALGPKFVDLDLGVAGLKNELKDIVTTWFGEGIDGILLKNAAFYFEGSTNGSLFLSGTNSSNEWFKSDPSRQIFQPESFVLVQDIREWVDEIAKKSGKPKLLVVDPGNTGYGTQTTDYAVHFLGTKEKPGAHVVVSRQFVNNRGWKATPPAANFTINSVEAYVGSSLGWEDRLALSTATPSDRHVGDLVSLASTFLLPGTKLLYYGAELGQEFRAVRSFATETYPKDKEPMVMVNENDSEWVCHLPMPWDRDGSGFSANSTTFSSFLDSIGIRETVETATAAGRGESPIQMVQALVRLHKLPSFQWGTLRQFVEQEFPSKNVEIFVRKAEGFPAYVNILLRGTQSFEEVIRLPAYCKSLRLQLAYPSLPDLDLHKEIDSNRVFIKVPHGPAVYVFECKDI